MSFITIELQMGDVFGWVELLVEYHCTPAEPASSIEPAVDETFEVVSIISTCDDREVHLPIQNKKLLEKLVKQAAKEQTEL